MTPLHYAAQIGNDRLIAEFLLAYPESIDELTVRKESAPHFAARHEKLASLKVLCRWLWMSGQRNQVLGWTDVEGNTTRDIAENQRSNLEIREFLKKLRAPCNRRKNNLFPFKVSIFAENLLRPSMFERFSIPGYRQWWRTSQEERSVILMVFTLIATTTYQAVLSLPGGVWQGDTSLFLPESDTSSSAQDVKGLAQRIGWVKAHVIGATVLPKFLWVSFATLNTATFAISVSQICFMLSGRASMVLPLAFCWAFCYAIALYVILPGTVIPALLSFLLFLWLTVPFTEIALNTSLKISRQIKTWMFLIHLCFVF